MNKRPTFHFEDITAGPGRDTHKGWQEWKTLEDIQTQKKALRTQHTPFWGHYSVVQSYLDLALFLFSPWVPLFEIPWTAVSQASLSFAVSQSFLKLVSTESVMPSTHLILCHPLLLLLSIFPSTRVFSNELVLHIRWAKYWSFSISPSSEYSGLISFRSDWFGLLASKGLSRVFSSITIWENKFFGDQPFLWPNSHFHTWLLGKPYFWLYGPLSAKWCLFLIRGLGLL